MANDTLPDSFFRVLSNDEDAKFRQWARDNHKPGDPVNEVWHPTIRDECRKIDKGE